MADKKYERYSEASARRRSYLKTPAERREAADVYAQRQKNRSTSLAESENISETSPIEDWMRSEPIRKIGENPLFRVWQTGKRVDVDLKLGALKAVEGVADAALGLGGAAAGLFSQEAQDRVKDWIRFDATEEWVGKHLKSLTQYSYTTEGKVGEIVENVAGSVGQMLPAVVVSIATSGAATPTLGAQAATKAGQAAALSTLSVGAAGGATEEAFADGADYYPGLGYGALRGATEAATEKLVGQVGGKLVGKGLADKAVRNMAKSAVGEGAEEAVSELLNPLTKTVYQGKEALNEYQNDEYWQGVGESALLGALSSMAFGGTVGQIYRRGSARLDADLETVADLQSRYERGKISAEAFHSEVGKALSDMEQTLKKTSESKRAQWFQAYRLSEFFDSDGSLKEDFARSNGFLRTETADSPSPRSETENLRSDSQQASKETTDVSSEEALDLAKETESESAETQENAHVFQNGETEGKIAFENGSSDSQSFPTDAEVRRQNMATQIEESAESMDTDVNGESKAPLSNSSESDSIRNESGESTSAPTRSSARKALSEMLEKFRPEASSPAEPIRRLVKDFLEEYQAESSESNEGEQRTEERSAFVEALRAIAENSESVFSEKEIRFLKKQVQPMIRFAADTEHQIFVDGRYTSAFPKAKQYVKQIQNLPKKSGGFAKGFRDYYRAFGDVASVMRYADGYEDNGFFTETLESFRRGRIDASVEEMNLLRLWDEFFGKRKSEKTKTPTPESAESSTNVFADEKRRAAGQSSTGLLRPVGNAMKNSSSANSISDINGNVNSFVKKSFRVDSSETLDSERTFSDFDEPTVRKKAASEVRAYQKHFTDDTVAFRNTQIPVRLAMSLYMTLQRKQAQLGFYLSGGELLLNREKSTFAPLAEASDSLSDKAVSELAAEEAQNLYRQFSEQDRQLIHLMEQTFESCGRLKEKTDKIRYGVSHVLKHEYYYPIRRSGNPLSAVTFYEESDRVNRPGFDHATVERAAGKLLIEPVDVVFLRHVRGISLYGHLAVPMDNFQKILNLNLSGNPNRPMSVQSELRKTAFGDDMYHYLMKLKQDVEGGSLGEQDLGWFHRALGTLRGNWAKYQLGLNVKSMASQFSSLMAATDLLSYDSVVRGIGIRETWKQVDRYCPLAELRHYENSAVLAQGVLEKTGKISEKAMRGLTQLDRRVVAWIFGGCQIQVQKDRGLALGSEANLKAAGDLLEKVILETQQNALATERSAAMRSNHEILKSFTMFSADNMKITGRLIDAVGRTHMLNEKLKTMDARHAEAVRRELQKSKKSLAKSFGTLLATAVYQVLIAEAFRRLIRRDDEERDASDYAVDMIGNMLGGLPFVRDIYSYFSDGYEMEVSVVGVMNTLLEAVESLNSLAGDVLSGRSHTTRDLTLGLRKLLYAAGQFCGIPLRNLYNLCSGALKWISPDVGYQAESYLFSKNYRSDLKKAIADGDEKLAKSVAGVLVKETAGSENETVSRELQSLLSRGYHRVLPKATGDTVSLNGQTLTLNNTQRKRFLEIYRQAEAHTERLIRSSAYQSADVAVQAEAIRFVFDVYYERAWEDLSGEAVGKNALFAEAIGAEELAMIVCTAKQIKADKDRNGKTVSGSKKAKIIAYLESLKLSAAKKYMLLGYLGYQNADGEGKVLGYIKTLKLSKAEKQSLLRYSGYAE